MCVQERTPKVHVVRRLPSTPGPTPTDTLLSRLCKGAPLRRRQMYERHLRNPEQMTKVTYQALQRLAEELRREGSLYHAVALEEIRRILDLAPERARVEIA